MEFLKAYLYTIVGSILAYSVAVLTIVFSLVVWIIIPPIAHIFTSDGMEYTKRLTEKVQYIVNKK